LKRSQSDKSAGASSYLSASSRMTCGKTRVGFLAIGVVSFKVRKAPLREVTSALSRSINPIAGPMLTAVRRSRRAQHPALGVTWQERSPDRASQRGLVWPPAIRAACHETFLAARAYLVCELCSVAGIIAMGGGFDSGFFGFGFAAGPSPAAAADTLSWAAALGAATLGFGFAAVVSPEETVEDAPSFPPLDLLFGFTAGAVVADAASLSLAAAGLIVTVFFFSGFGSLVACDPGAGGLVPV